MAELLVDTDVCIDHLEDVRRLPGRRSHLGYSVVTRVELFVGADDETEESAIRGLLRSMDEYPVDRRVADEAGRVRREHGLRLADALIAATALVHGFTLHTRNVRDFRRVRGLRLRPSRS